MATESKENNQKYGRGQNPNSRKNLKMFSPGVSGNPGGKPSGFSIAAAIREQLRASGETTVTGVIKKIAGDKKNAVIGDEVDVLIELPNKDAIAQAALWHALDRGGATLKEVIRISEAKEGEGALPGIVTEIHFELSDVDRQSEIDAIEQAESQEKPE